jgi:transcriptional regulator with XRE-family HTH domain/anti-sigma regulatory factor (Ser/Thr protein kinase)
VSSVEAEAEVIPLGSRLRHRREQLGLTQAQAARQLDVARTAYRLWEMEAARPAPDRWRTIAGWLGISMTAMLFAQELLDQQEALDAQAAADASGMSEIDWDVESDASPGDYFSQQRAMIADQAQRGHISADQAATLARAVSRVQNATSDNITSQWHPGKFRKRLPNDQLSPALARAALGATSVGIATTTFDSAELVISELVTNSVKHSGSEWVDVAVDLGTDVLRIEVSDTSRETIRPPSPDGNGGWGLTLIAELATRWGVERHRTGKTIWIEFDLTV